MLHELSNANEQIESIGMTINTAGVGNLYTEFPPHPWYGEK